MKIELLHHTPLWIASKAIRRCWASEDRCDTKMHVGSFTTLDGEVYMKSYAQTGEKDKALIHKVGNKNKHASTLEHLNYTFDIDGISRACLQELARHRHASMSVKSSRYTLKELKNARDCELQDFMIDTGRVDINSHNVVALSVVRDALNGGEPNDRAKYLLPEAYKTSLVWTINARSLQNFLALRTNKAALWEIQDLANTIYENLPEDHIYLFKEFIYVK